MRYFGTLLADLLIAALIICFWGGFATASRAAGTAPKSTLILKTTNGFLPPGSKRLGLLSDYGLSERALIGTELPALLVGAANVYGKLGVWEGENKAITIGGDLVYISRRTLLWGEQRANFERLDIRGFHPRLIFTQAFSERLLIHSSWEGGLEKGDITLSENGKRRLWRNKYPNGDYDSRRRDGKPSSRDGSALQEDLGITHRSLVLQSLLGLAQERFELSGEMIRSPRETLILSAHIARFKAAELEAQRLGLSIAQQWRSESFGFRLGIGVLYQVLSGRDLDDERIDDARFLPSADLDLFFIL